MDKKILAILLIALLAIISVCGVFALNFGNLFGEPTTNNGILQNQHPETITFKGIKFNIPAGFEVNTKIAKTEQTKRVGNVQYKVYIKNYQRENDTLSLGVADYENHTVTYENVKYAGGNEEKINGIEGYLKYYPAKQYNFKNNNNKVTIKTPAYYTFSYAKNGKLVTVTTNKKDIIPEVLIN